jgi:hypothetical protein
MKRIFITAAASAALVAGAVPAQAATSASDAQPAQADVPATLTATIPNSLINLGNITPGAAMVESADQTVNVKSNATWGIDVNADKTNMTEHDGVGYVTPGPKTLTNVFQWKVDAGSYAGVTTARAHALAAQSPTDDSGTDAVFKFGQTPSYSDTPLTGGNHYRIQVTYNVEQGL